MPQRTYRHDLRCPHYGSHGMPRYGTSRGKHPYTPDSNSHYYPEAVKSRAASMHPGGRAASWASGGCCRRRRKRSIPESKKPLKLGPP